MIFQIHLDPDLIEQFNSSLKAQAHLSAQLSFKKKAYRGIPAWDCICVCEHRIRDTVAYLNDQVLGKMEHGSAFDFINFINNAATVLDCVDMLAAIIGVDLTQEDARTAAFSQLGANGKGTDKKYFQFIRSLCAVHPAETSHFRGIYHDSALVTCPYLVWVRGTFREMTWDCDLHAKAFINEANSWGEDVFIHMDQIFAYIKYRYSLLNKIGCSLESYQRNVIETLRGTCVPGRGANETEQDFIERIKGIEEERLGSGNAYLYDFAKKAISFAPSNPRNTEAAKRYANAWRFALDCRLTALRDMSFDDLKVNDGADLIDQLIDCRCQCKDLDNFSYNLEKLVYLNGNYGPDDAAWGRAKLLEMNELLGSRVLFGGASDDELYLLSRIALYEISLLHPGYINKLIPRDLRYRPEDAM